jgi:hypothetical protein
MADLIIKPATGASNSLIIKDQAGNAIITTGTSGGTIDSGVTWTSPVINTGISGTAVLDEDAMGSDSATKIATQQSIKAYADTKAPIAGPTFTGTVAIPNVANVETAVVANTAKVTNATHSGEVTGATALTITDDIVDEANLKISNAGSNGQFLSKQSGNTGGLTWATVADPTTGISDTNFLVANANVADDDFLRVDGTSIEGRTATEVLSDLGSGTPGSGNFLRGDGSWASAGFASGTKMIFNQTAAPTGWTKVTSATDVALRLTSGTVGTGGTVAFETAFASQTVPVHTLTIAQMPAHGHELMGGAEEWNQDGLQNWMSAADQGAISAYVDAVGDTGGGGSHGHGSIDLDVSYVDVIIATKN